MSKALKGREVQGAEASCERVIGYSENLPKESYLERHSGYVAVGIAQMRQQKFREAIANFECALEIAKPSLGDTDSETADVYFLIGQSHHLNGNIGAARAYYEAAEKTYRAAFKHMGDDKFFLVPYSRKIRDVVEAHYLLVRNAGLELAAEILRKRLDDVDKEFAEFLDRSK